MLTTQTFLKMLESIKRFKWQSAPFSAWLFRIAHNLAMDHFRATAPLAAGGRGARARRARASRPPRPRRCRSIGRQSDARADREPLDGATAGPHAEVRVQPAERRGRDDPRQDRGCSQVACSTARSCRCRSRSPETRSASLALEVGIVGLPSSGKSTLFHALTGAHATGRRRHGRRSGSPADEDRRCHQRPQGHARPRFASSR